MKAEIISIGTELLMGELTDTNSSWIASRLPALGIQLELVSIIGDDLPKLTEAFRARLGALGHHLSRQAAWDPRRTT